MLSAADNEILTQTGAGTPMGALFRRFWVPVLLSEQLPEPDCAPVRVTVMGESLLAFRDSAGRVGLIEPRCPHRGADLFYGRNECGGLRCVYHGWKFGFDGECLEMPTHDPDDDKYDRIRERARIAAYPAREWGDFVWAYMGPPERKPELPHMEFALVPPAHRFVSKKRQDCNWAQSAEGGLDTAHFSFLHVPVARSEDEFRSSVPTAVKGFSARTMSHDQLRWIRDDPRPRYGVIRHPAGLVLGASRKADGNHYWRMAQFLMPCHGYTPSAAKGENYHGQTWVPIDDRSCWVYCYTWNPDRPLTDAERDSFRNGGAIYSQVDENWVPVRNRGNEYLIDRVAQKTSSYTGVQGISEQDAMIQDSQGPIVDRTREMLGPTDIGVVQFRRLMLGAAKDLQRGIEPEAAACAADYRVRAGGIVVPAAQSLEDAMTARFGDPTGRVLDRMAG